MIQCWGILRTFSPGKVTIFSGKSWTEVGKFVIEESAMLKSFIRLYWLKMLVWLYSLGSFVIFVRSLDFLQTFPAFGES